MSNGPVFESKAGWGGQFSAWFSKNKYYAFPGAVILLLLIIWIASSYSKPANNLLTSITPSASTTPVAQSPAITVIKGDSYTTVARRAVISTATGQSSGAKLYAETKLAHDLKTQPLKIGTMITYSAESITKYLTDYNNLFASQKIKWESWAKNTKF